MRRGNFLQVILMTEDDISRAESLSLIFTLTISVVSRITTKDESIAEDEDGKKSTRRISGL